MQVSIILIWNIHIGMVLGIFMGFKAVMYSQRNLCMDREETASSTTIGFWFQ